ncbi:hypothetical protein GCM10009827_003370 [Dactylosporangium maewongense]|uniref:Uncharacterized protein n=1 Tax=Dactylosporangium maewongense TaxID=634393 RepID=A0ABN1ZIS5_9ACTN
MPAGDFGAAWDGAPDGVWNGLMAASAYAGTLCGPVRPCQCAVGALSAAAAMVLASQQEAHKESTMQQFATPSPISTLLGIPATTSRGDITARSL